MIGERVQAVTATGKWVIDGNYSTARHHIWQRAIRRTTSQELLWGTNRETWQCQFFSRPLSF